MRRLCKPDIRITSTGRRGSLTAIAALICMSLAACDSTYGCLEIDGPCTSTTPQAATFILGLDPGLLDRSVTVNGGYRAVLPVGTTVKFWAVRDARGEAITASDTLRSVTWSLTDAGSATLTPAADGSAQLAATKIGRVGMIRANGTSILYACTAGPPHACSAVGAIDVVAR